MRSGTAPNKVIFFFNDTATTEIYTLSLHDALPILAEDLLALAGVTAEERVTTTPTRSLRLRAPWLLLNLITDRKSTRLNSSHLVISYAVFCLKKKTVRGSGGGAGGRGRAPVRVRPP